MQTERRRPIEGRVFKTMDRVVGQALANWLLVILGFLADLAISPDPESNGKEFLESWTVIAEHCKNRPDMVLFEVLNEPADKFPYDSWDEYWRTTIWAKFDPAERDPL
jgi:hypothetical protein